MYINTNEIQTLVHLNIFKNLNTGTSKNTGFIKKRYNCGGVSVSQLNKNNRYTKPD